MVRRVLAGVVVDDLPAADRWYERVFGRAHDAAPMDGLLEWHFADGGWLQVADIAMIRAVQKQPRWGAAIGHPSRLSSNASTTSSHDLRRNIQIGQCYDGPDFRTATLSDPSGNLVTFVEEVT